MRFSWAFIPRINIIGPQGINVQLYKLIAIASQKKKKLPKEQKFLS